MNAIKPLGGIFDFDIKKSRLDQISKELEDPSIWNDQGRSQTLGKEKRELDFIVNGLSNLASNLKDQCELFELARNENDDETLKVVLDESHTLEKSVEAMEFRCMFSHPMDPNNCFINFQSGSGGTEAQDWANMLLRMYIRYGERKGFKVEVLDISDGDIAGIKSATLKISGDYAFGHLRTETGVHRLVRKSPFDSGNRRHTSFASVQVYPEVDDSIEVDINPADLRIDTYRASGAGGQHINKTDSAVRITHIPTGIVVSCQNEKSQLQNKESALRILRARMLAAAQEEAERIASAERKNQVRTVDRSERIRTYNFPENRLSDHRVNYKANNLDSVMNGDLEAVIQSLIDADRTAKLSAGNS